MIPTKSILITGASGFLGRHILAAAKEKYRVFALARKSQKRVRAPFHPNISWHRADITDPKALGEVFDEVKAAGGVDVVLHLAAHYDFTGEDCPEYWRTNVEGLRNILDQCRTLKPKQFVFASSVAACRFPAPGKALDESSPADGDIPYAITKRMGEEMLAEYRDAFPSCIVRLGALFSDWCEYPPLYIFLKTWLSDAWARRILAGKGVSSVPYLHIRDAVSFFLRVADRHSFLDPGEVLIASVDGAQTHEELFRAATREYFPSPPGPVFLPKPLCRVGLHVQDLAGRLLGERPFERPWMAKYIDWQLRVDGSRTRKRIGWSPNPRLHILRRLPFLVDNFSSDPGEWSRRNWAAMKIRELSGHQKIHALLETNEQRIVAEALAMFRAPENRQALLVFSQLDQEDLEWAVGQTFRNLVIAIRGRDKSVFRSYCRNLAERRFNQGLRCEDLCEGLTRESDILVRVLREDPASKGLEKQIHDHVTMTFLMGIDEVQDVFEEMSGKFVPADDWE